MGIDEGADGQVQALWSNNSDNTASEWLFDTIDKTSATFRVGPFTGWTAVSAAESASQRHILWHNATTGQISIWNVGNSGSCSSYALFNNLYAWTPIMMSARH
jgi:hypothetical protein